MSFFKEKMNELRKKFDGTIEGIDSGAFNTIFDDFHLKFSEKHDLPPIYVWEDGFVQGEASPNDLVELEANLEEMYNTEIEFSIDVDGDYDAIELLKFLDKKFIEGFKEKVDEFLSKKTAQQRQFEQVKDKLQSLLCKIEETMKLMPTKGQNKMDCKKIHILHLANELSYVVDKIEFKDFTPNEHSGDFKLSYS